MPNLIYDLCDLCFKINKNLQNEFETMAFNLFNFENIPVNKNNDPDSKFLKSSEFSWTFYFSVENAKR